MNTHPLSDFVREAEAHIAQIKGSRSAEILTVNGRAEVVVQDVESYQAMLVELERGRFVDSLVDAERDYEEGKGRPAEEFFAEAKARYGV